MRTQIQFLKTPSRHDVEVTIKALEIEDEWEREALRKFYARERPGFKVSAWKLTVFLFKVLCASAVIWALLVLALSASL